MSARWGEPPWKTGDFVSPGGPPSRCEVAVVGAGLTGLSAALHLARRGVRAVVLEAGRIGEGASGRTGAVVLEGTAAGDLDDVDRCLPGLEALVRRERIECGLELPGCSELVHRPRGVRERAWRDGDLDLVVAGRVAGGTVDAGALVGGLARAALAAGAAIHTRTRVVRLDTDSPGGLVLERGRIDSDRVVLALNAYTPRLRPLEALRCALTLAASTPPLSPPALAAIGLEPRIPFYTVDLPYLWGHARPDGRIIFGAGLRFGAAEELETIGVDRDEPKEALDRLEARVRGLHPALAGVRFERRWAGPIAIPAGRPPFLGPDPERPEVIVTGGYAGHGVALAVRVGELVAASITGERPLPAWGALPEG